jgi:hypothetical protein
MCKTIANPDLFLQHLYETFAKKPMKHLKHLKHKACNIRFSPFFRTTQCKAGELPVAIRRPRMVTRPDSGQLYACAWPRPSRRRPLSWPPVLGTAEVVGVAGDSGGGTVEWDSARDGGAAGDGNGDAAERGGRTTTRWTSTEWKDERKVGRFDFF